MFKTEPLYAPEGSYGAVLQAFFTKGWSPQSSPAELLGFAYGYDEQGALIGEYGMGGADSTGNRQYVYLPTAQGPLPIVVMGDTSRWAVFADHLNTPRRLTDVYGQMLWQWAPSAFGEQPPTVAERKFNNVAPIPGEFAMNLRYPGQTHDEESGLSYNGNRSYDPKTGRYTQTDPIGLAGSFANTDSVSPFYKTSIWFDPGSVADGGINRFLYGNGNPLMLTDPMGLQSDLQPRRPNRPDWLQPAPPNRNCATAECAAGLLPVPSENRSAKDIEIGQCRLVCGMTVGPLVSACLKVGGLTTLGSQLVGRWATTDACKLVCE